MAIHFKYAPLPLLAALFAACSGSAEPDAVPSTPNEGDSAFALDAADSEEEGAEEGANAADVDKGHRRERGRRHRRGRGQHGGGGGHDPEPPPAGASCEAAGQTFPDGSGVPSGDSCNSCGCNDGSVICTLALCEPVVCAEFLEVPDGVCSRFPLDPCITQDPDCASGGGGGAACEAAGQTFPDGSDVPSGDSCNSCTCEDGSVICTLALCEPTVCAFFVEESDGVCSRFPLDPCISQDPDCVGGGGVACEAAGQSFTDGSDVPSGDSCNSCTCEDGSVICTLALCEPTVCALFVEESDGVCSRFPLDPCKSQDPDCLGGGGVTCEAAGQTFIDGDVVPSGDSCNSCGCNDGSVICTLALCEPTVCALFVEESDGVCSRFPLDPCISQDPDCTAGLEPSAP